MGSFFGRLRLAKDLFAYAAEFVRQFNELEPVDRHDLWSNIDLTGFGL